MTPWFGDAWSIVSLRGLGTDSDSRHKQVMLGVMAMGPQQLSQSQPRKLLDSRLRSSRWHVLVLRRKGEEELDFVKDEDGGYLEKWQPRNAKRAWQFETLAQASYLGPNRLRKRGS